MLVEFIDDLKSRGDAQNQALSEVEITFDSAYCVQFVLKAVFKAELRCVTKPDNNHKFEFEDQLLTPNELVEKVKNSHWEYLGPNRLYQRQFTTVNF